MPNLSVWAIRLSLGYLVFGTTIGGLLLAGKAMEMPPWLWLLRAVHVEALMFGFMIQLVLGVAYWMLPRAPVVVGTRLMGLALLLLNVGVGLVSAEAVVPPGVGLLLAGRVCETASLALFAAHVWPRVRAVRLHVHEDEAPRLATMPRPGRDVPRLPPSNHGS